MVLGQYLRAREVAANKVVTADITDDKGVKQVLRIQGQASGLDLAIQIIFDLVNEAMEKIEEDHNARDEGRPAELSGDFAI